MDHKVICYIILCYLTKYRKEKDGKLRKYRNINNKKLEFANCVKKYFAVITRSYSSFFPSRSVVFDLTSGCRQGRPWTCMWRSVAAWCHTGSRDWCRRSRACRAGAGHASVGSRSWQSGDWSHVPPPAIHELVIIGNEPKTKHWDTGSG